MGLNLLSLDFRMVKTLLKVFLGLILLLVLSFVLLITFINQPFIKAPILSEVSKAVNRKVDIAGHIDVSVLPNFSLTLNDIYIDNADWGTATHAVEVKKLNLRVSLQKLIGGIVDVKAFTLEDPHVWLEMKDGVSNLELVKTEDSDTPAEFPTWLRIKRAEITGGMFHYKLNTEDAFEDIGLPKVLLETISTAEEGRLNTQTQVTLNALYNDQSVMLESSLAGLEDLSLGKSSSLDATLNLANAGEIKLTGTVGKLLEFADVALQANVSLSDLANLSQLSGITLPSLEDINGSLQINREGLGATNLNALELNGRNGDLTLALSGDISAVDSDADFAVAASVTGQTPFNALFKQTDINNQLVADIKTRIQGQLPNLTLEIEKGDVQSDLLSVNVSEQSLELAQDWSSPVAVSAQIDSLAKLGELLDIDLPEINDVRIRSELLRKENKFLLPSITVTSQNQLLNGQASGDLAIASGQLSGTQNLDIDLATSVLDHWVDGLSATGLKDINLKGQLIPNEESLSLNEIALSTTGEASSVFANGEWKALDKIASLDLDINIDVNSASQLSQLATVTLPDLGPVNLKAKLTGDGAEVLNLNDALLKLDHAGSALQVEGAYRDLLSDARDLQLAIKLDMQSHELLDQVLIDIVELPEEEVTRISERLAFITPINARADFHFNDQDLRLDNIQVSAKDNGIDTNVSGAFSQLNPLAGALNFSSKGKLVDSYRQRMPKRLERLFDHTIDLNGRVRVADDIWSIDGLKALFDSQKSTLTIDGDIDDIVLFRSGNLKLKFAAQEVGNVYPLETVMNAKLPIDLTVTMDQRQAQSSQPLQNLKLEMTLGNSDVNGDFSWQLMDLPSGNKGLDFKGAFESSVLDINQITDAQKVKPEEKKNTSGKLFSPEPLDLSFLQDHKIDIALKTDKFIGPLLTINQWLTDLKVNDGKATFVSKGNTQKGEIIMDIKADTHVDALALDVKIDGKGIETAALTELGVKESVDQGNDLDFNIVLNSRGNSIQELAGQSNGGLRLEMRDAKLNNSVLKLVGGDILTGVVDVINPFVKKEKYLNLDCAAVSFAIRDGQIDEQKMLALKTSAVTVMGSADINLDTEDMELYFVPKARKGLGVSASTVVKMVRIGGTLTNPSLETDAGGLLKSGASIGAAFATGGLSLLAQGLFDRVEASSDVCKDVLAGEIPDAEEAAAQTKAAISDNNSDASSAQRSSAGAVSQARSENESVNNDEAVQQTTIERSEIGVSVAEEAKPSSTFNEDNNLLRNR